MTNQNSSPVKLTPAQRDLLKRLAEPDHFDRYEMSLRDGYINAQSHNAKTRQALIKLGYVEAGTHLSHNDHLLRITPAGRAALAPSPAPVPDDEIQRPGESHADWLDRLGLPPEVDTSDEALAKLPILNLDDFNAAPNADAPTVHGYKIGDGVMHKRLNKNATIVGFRTWSGAGTPSEIVSAANDLWVEVKDTNGDLLGWDFKDLADFSRSAPARQSSEAEVKPTERDQAMAMLDAIADRMGYVATVAIREYIYQLESQIATYESNSK